jgi:hypothetical protein
VDASRELLDLGRRLVLDSVPAPQPAPPPTSEPGPRTPAGVGATEATA